MAKPISKSTFSGGITTLHIGPKRVAFHVHTDLLTGCSTYFAELLNTQSQQQNGNPVVLSNENPNIVHLFLNWIYHGKIFGSSYADSPPDWSDLIHLWLLGERIQTPALQSDVISHCYLKVGQNNINHNNSNSAVCPLDVIEYAFKNTSQGSPLRRLIAEVWAENAGKVKSSGRLINKLPVEFLKDLCFVFVKKAQVEGENELVEEPKKEEVPREKSREGKRQKKTEPESTSQQSTEVDIDLKTETKPTEEPVVPVLSVAETSQPKNDAPVVPHVNGIEEGTPGVAPPQEQSFDENKSIVDSSTQVEPSQSSKKKKKNKKNNKGTINGISEPSSSIPREETVATAADEGISNSVLSPAKEEEQQQDPVLDGEQAWLPREWTATTKTGNAGSSIEEGWGGSVDFSSKKKPQHKNKSSRFVPNGQQSSFIPTGPRAGKHRQNNSFSPAQSFANTGKYNNNHQAKQNNRRNNDWNNTASGPVSSPRNERKQKTTSRLDPALQSPSQPMRNGAPNQGTRDFKQKMSRK